MPSIFTRIISGEIPCHKIAETDTFISFLDIRPLAKGHALVIPKKEVDYIFDLDDELLAALSVFAKKVARAIEATVSCKRVGMLVVGTEVPHTHIHLIPFQNESQMCMDNQRIDMGKNDMDALAEKIANAYKNQNRNK